MNVEATFRFNLHLNRLINNLIRTIEAFIVRINVGKNHRLCLSWHHLSLIFRRGFGDMKVEDT